MTAGGIANLSVVLALCGLLAVSAGILISISGDKRRHRIGATLLPAWCVTMVTIYGLRLMDDALMISPALLRIMFAVGICLMAWALLDVSRLTRAYGTTTLLQAAEVAKGLMLSRQANEAAWADWARHLPTPAWLKGQAGMLVINRAYEAAYGKPAEGYAGESDTAMWDVDIAERFGGNDQIVIQTGKHHRFFESAPRTGQANVHVGEFVKFPVFDSHGRLLGVGGLEIEQ